jgi:hypothetical protein
MSLAAIALAALAALQDPPQEIIVKASGLN